MKDRYANTFKTIERLNLERERYGKLIIAFDFDNTIFDYHSLGDTYPAMIDLLQRATALGHTMVLFSCMNDPEMAKVYCNERDIGIDYVNTSPVEMGSIKPYFNILLDDRAGLSESMYILDTILKAQEAEL